MLNGELTKLRGTLTKRYAAVIRHTRLVASFVESKLYAERALARKREAILLAYAENPKELGANEAAREATINSRCLDEVAHLLAAEGLLRDAKRDLELATLGLDEARAVLRVYEVAAATLPWREA